MARPNVYYELGFAQALSKPVVLICRADEYVHFDVRDYRIYYYNDHLGLAVHVERELVQIKGLIEALRVSEVSVEAVGRKAADAKLERLRSSNKVERLRADDHDKLAYEIRYDSYAFITSWSWDKIISGANDVSVTDSSHGTSDLEVHMFVDGRSGFVLFENANRPLDHMIDGAQEVYSVVTSPKFVPGEFEEPFFVLTSDIAGMRDRSTPNYRTIIDLYLRPGATIVVADDHELAMDNEIAAGTIPDETATAQMPENP